MGCVSSQINPMDNHISFNHKDIIRDLLSRKDVVTVKAIGDSMWPFIREGDMVVLKKCNIGDLSIGDIVVYTNKNSDTLVSHRVVKKIKEGVFSKGDGWLSRCDIVNKDNLIGRLIRIIRKDKILDLDSSLYKGLNRIIAWMSLRVPLVLFIRSSSRFY